MQFIHLCVHVMDVATIFRLRLVSRSFLVPTANLPRGRRFDLFMHACRCEGMRLITDTIHNTPSVGHLKDTLLSSLRSVCMKHLSYAQLGKDDLHALFNPDRAYVPDVIRHALSCGAAAAINDNRYIQIIKRVHPTEEMRVRSILYTQILNSL